MNLWVSDQKRWRASPSLGNRQVESLERWLRTGGIEDREGCLTPLGKLFVAKGTTCLPLWEMLWVNVVFNFPTARWYVHLGRGEWTTSELKSLLRAAVLGLAERTVSNAITELASFLQRTPVGRELRQGEVIGGTPRRVVRRGLEPCDAAIVHSLWRLYLQQHQTRLPWGSDLTWPWVVFGCSKQFVIERLIGMPEGYFDIDEHGLTLRAEGEEWWECGGMMIS
ncbi:MAG TPA: hypothetical protein GX510_10470 [Firmicutes bacterium]|nr:hypothetical protein [Candidatus Fermentithermobacillaceae bacterium]